MVYGVYMSICVVELARKLKMMSSTAYTGTYGVILSKNCGVKSQWYMGFICPYVLFGYVARKT